MTSAHHRLVNVCVLVDSNRFQSQGQRRGNQERPASGRQVGGFRLGRAGGGRP